MNRNDTTRPDETTGASDSKCTGGRGKHRKTGLPLKIRQAQSSSPDDSEVDIGPDEIRSVALAAHRRDVHPEEIWTDHWDGKQLVMPDE